MPAGRGHPSDALDKPAPRVLPGLPGGPPLLPADRTVGEGEEGQLVIFDGDDVVQALRQLHLASEGAIVVSIERDGRYSPRAIEAMRVAMMFTLNMAAINLDVPPG